MKLYCYDKVNCGSSSKGWTSIGGMKNHFRVLFEKSWNLERNISVAIKLNKHLADITFYKCDTSTGIISEFRLCVTDDNQQWVLTHKADI